MSVYKSAGQRTFVHQCEGHGPHEVTISWGGLDQGLIYPELDLATHAKCSSCGDLFTPHSADDCAAARDRDATHSCDDHTAGLVALPEPDPDDVALQQLQRDKWQLEQKHLIQTMEQLLEAGQLDERQSIDAKISLLTARRELRRFTQGEAK